jgi:hypothetical protein
MRGVAAASATTGAAPAPLAPATGAATPAAVAATASAIATTTLVNLRGIPAPADRCIVFNISASQFSACRDAFTPASRNL